MVDQTLRALVMVALVGLFMSCGDCGEVAGPPVEFPDVGGDVEEDVDDRDTDPDADVDEPDVPGEPDADAGEPEERLCPESIQDSCLAPALNCLGDAAAMSQCVEFGEPGESGHRISALFSNGAVVEYREINTDDGPREFRATFGPDGERCYNLRALEAGSEPLEWNLSEAQFGSFDMVFEGDSLEVECSGDGMERCTVARYENAFAMPWERPEGCEPADSNDQCELDSECGEGLACCRPDGDSVRQCLDLEFCWSQRDPIPCETSADCVSGQSCSRCTWSGVRECVPDEIVEDPDNSLGCVADGCAPGGGDCEGDRICCDIAGVLECIFPTECSSAPDPNPVCDPESSQPCPSGAQECCFLDQPQQFRCLTNVPFCVTEVCFSDADCPDQQECCGVDSGGMTAGSCFESCEPPDLSCTEQEDCFGDQYCCIAPGLSDGQCVSNEMACEFLSCDVTADCNDPSLVCCDDPPLTEAICLEECP